ncbi:MAG: hypothetical protein ACRBN8_45805 [Nannocystales bacterium]
MTERRGVAARWNLGSMLTRGVVRWGMDKVASNLREAMGRYYRVQAVAFVRRKAKGPADPGFEPLSDDEFAALEELVSAIEDVRDARVAWVAAGRPSLG